MVKTSDPVGKDKADLKKQRMLANKKKVIAKKRAKKTLRLKPE